MSAVLVERPPGLSLVERSLVGLSLVVLSVVGLATPTTPAATRPTIVIDAEDGAKEFGSDLVADGKTLAAFDFECTGRKNRCYTVLRIFDVAGDRATQVYREHAILGAGLYDLAGDTFVQRHRRHDEGWHDELHFLTRTQAGWQPSSPIAIAAGCRVADWESWGGELTLGKTILVASNHDAACLYERRGDTWQHTETFRLHGNEGVTIEVAGDRVLLRYLAYIEVYERSGTRSGGDTWHRRLIAPPRGHQFWNITVGERWLVAHTGRGDTMDTPVQVYDVATGSHVATLEPPPTNIEYFAARVAVSDTTIVAAGTTIRAWHFTDGAWRARSDLTPNPPTRASYPRPVAIGDFVWVGEPVETRPSSRGGMVQGYRVAP